ncbi:hypothetical protein CHS0354_017011 [Potamilus streckersoni]|uniref:Uncharacterized protein n=1 Tax=Potamilus streckersoni TaxID=2493646 RepID=A0AAE0SM86_9BIVA|nr:hypothetical protein CHS0354_017011 [Potamilus streckersoni]
MNFVPTCSWSMPKKRTLIFELKMLTFICQQRLREYLTEIQSLGLQIPLMGHLLGVVRMGQFPFGHHMNCSFPFQDGSVSFWSSQLELKKTKSVINTEQTIRSKPKWITDFVIMPQYTKFIVGTGDREIQFFELSSFEPYCQISGLETVPLKLDYCATGHDECLIMYGDSHGIVNILVLNNVGECLRTWKKCPKHEKFIASISLNDAIEKGDSVQFIRWKVHGDWLNEIKYYHEIGQVISCSNHANTALVIGCTTGSTHIEQQLKGIKDLNQGQEKSQKRQFSHLNVRHRLESDQSVFKVYKGVKCFDFSKEKNIIVTGGMDRIVRLWNPYVPGKPTAMLRGHGAPIFFLCIAEEENRIFSFSTDKCLRVWDIQDHTCLLTVRPKGHKIRGDLQACHYSSISKTLIIATDQMAALNLRQKPNLHADIVTSHKEPVTCCMYNPSFKQVVSCSEGSAVKLWDLETGTPIFEYGGAHGDSAITCMTFDNSGRRLITGGRDGVIRMWNYNNGHCLKVLQKEEDNEEICDLTYIEMNKNRYVVAVGWDRRINIYSDSLTDSNIHHVRHPLPKWKDDLQRGHTEDILAVAKSIPNLLATASYDGKIIVWNMVSGHIFCHVSSPVPAGYEDQSLDGDLSIHQLVFMESRAYKKDAASLIASGPRGHIHFWRVFQGGCLMAQFKGCKNEGTTVTSMKLDSANINLYTGDSMGFICIWNVNGYCLKGPSTDPPEMLQSWRGHVKSISTVELMEEKNLIITASKDCTVRLWNKEGHYIGTFGQQTPWDIYNPDTFEHPMVPYDVLIDPMSLPFHPLLQEKQNTQQIIHEDTFKSEEDRLTPTPPIIYSKQQFLIDDEAIAKQIKEKAFKKGTGKRLRHEKLKPVKVDRGGPSEFQMLRIEDLAETPRPKTPTLKVNKNDPFDFSVD